MNVKDKDALKQKINDDSDFIYCPRLGNSLSKLIEKNPDGIDDERIKKVLLISQEELDGYFNSAIQKLKKYVTDKR